MRSPVLPPRGRDTLRKPPRTPGSGLLPRSPRRVALTLALAVAVVACDAALRATELPLGTRDMLAAEPPAVSLRVGASAHLAAALHPALLGERSPLAGRLRWSRSDPSVTSATPDAVVTGVAPGTARIRVTSPVGTVSADVTVRPSSPEITTARRRPASERDRSDDPPASRSTAGIWIGRAELARLPTSGPAWANVSAEAARRCGTPDLADQSQRTNVCIMAKALVFARTGRAPYREDVVAALRSIVGSGRYRGRALALGRQLGAYVIAADLIALGQHDPALDAAFRAKLRELLTTPTTGGPSSLVECHELRPNNWGNHCGGSRAAVAVYLGDRGEVDRAARVFRGYLGDRSAYAGFVFGGPAGSRDNSWQCDERRPVGINPAGCTRGGRSVDGVLPDDQRRGGRFRWPPPRENYVYEGLQGALMQAVILSRQGYDVWNWGDRALLRAFRWLHDVAGYPAEGDDTWQPHVVNRAYGTRFPAPVPSRPGKNVGWTDWTHG